MKSFKERFWTVMSLVTVAILAVGFAVGYRVSRDTDTAAAQSPPGRSYLVIEVKGVQASVNGRRTVALNLYVEGDIDAIILTDLSPHAADRMMQKLRDAKPAPIISVPEGLGVETEYDLTVSGDATVASLTISKGGLP